MTKKQRNQFIAVIVVLIICIVGYFGLDYYYDQKEESKEEDSIIAFGLEEDYENVTWLTYIYEGEEITLINNDGEWSVSGDDSIDVDASEVEDNMLALLISVEASQVIEAPEDIAEYGFETNDDGVMEPSTNTITIVDADDNTYVLYIGDANAYDSSLYYMMIGGDDNVYVIDSAIPDGFAKSLEDIEEETTTEEATTEEETEEDADSNDTEDTEKEAGDSEDSEDTE